MRVFALYLVFCAGNHLVLARKLASSPDITVSVVNPRAVKDFARNKMIRGKTDHGDAKVLAWYGEAMQPAAWQPPAQLPSALSQLSRHFKSLTKRKTALANRIKSCRSRLAPKAVMQDLDFEQRGITQRIEKLRSAALELIAGDAELRFRYEQLVSITGFAEKSAITILAELSVLPQDLGKKQWIASAGLDPVPNESGKSLRGRRMISRQGNSQLRTALNFPALVAARHCAQMKEYYLSLQRRGLPKLAAICAVMRKLLQIIWGMFRRNELFNPSKVTACRA